jgi:membrane-bound lytic murein transglycosylase D
MYNSIKPVHYLLFLILFIITGCAEKPTTHAFVYEKPAEINPVPATSSVDTPANNNRYHKQFNQLPGSHKTIWDRLLSLYALPPIENHRIDKEVQRYLDHPDYLVNIQRRAEPYLYFILDEIESKKIPGELALLPVVESAFKTNAISKSRASGLWQFMPATGRFFGLKQNWWYDGRNDIYTSTRAATTYLSQLSKLFDDDWLLALAAYNTGKGNLKKAINKNRAKGLGTDYWSLSLHKETMNYVPRLLAIARIFANTEKYNIPLLPFPNKPYFAVVNIESQMDLTLATEMAQIPLTDFFILNPAFKRASTDPDGPFHLLIHVDKADSFKEKLAQTQKKDRIKWIRHKIKSGENLGIIARKYQSSVEALRHGNKLANNNIRAGHFLLIPSSRNNRNPAATKSNKRLYIVKKGDTLWEIARQFNVTTLDIANWNNLSVSNVLRPGQKLVIKRS